MKRYLSIVLIATMILSFGSVTAIAENEPSPIVTVTPYDGVLPSPIGEVDVLSENYLRGTSEPTVFWDLSGGNDYSWSFSGLRQRIFTERYFSGVTSFRCTTNVTKDYTSGPSEYVVSLWSKGKRVTTGSTIPVGTTYNVTFSQLQPGTTYYVCWEYAGGSGQTCSGSGWISEMT